MAVVSSASYDSVPTWHKNEPTMVCYPTNTVNTVYAPGTITTVNTTGVPKNNISVILASVTGLVVGMYIATSPINDYTVGTTILSINVPNLTIITSSGPQATINSGVTYVFTLP